MHRVKGAIMPAEDEISEHMAPNILVYILVPILCQTTHPDRIHTGGADRTGRFPVISMDYAFIGNRGE